MGRKFSEACNSNTNHVLAKHRQCVLRHEPAPAQKGEGCVYYQCACTLGGPRSEIRLCYFVNSHKLSSSRRFIISRWCYRLIAVSYQRRRNFRVWGVSSSVRFDFLENHDSMFVSALLSHSCTHALLQVHTNVYSEK